MAQERFEMAFIKGGREIPVGLAVAAVVLIVAILVFFGWKTVGGGGGPREGDKVAVDINKVKADMKSGGFGGH
jgi:hypothetical protein